VKADRACRVATPSFDGPGLNPAALKGLADKRPGWGIGGFPVKKESAEEPEKRGKRH
jgi:hypothetical protein